MLGVSIKWDLIVICRPITYSLKHAICIKRWQASPKMSGIAFLFFTLVGALFTALGVFIVAQSARSKWWPQTIGTITSTEVRKVERKNSGYYSEGTYHSIGYSVTYDPHVDYEYAVEGTKYRNDKLTLALQPSILESIGAETILKAYPVGGRVKVFYKRSDPSVSTLHSGSSRGNLYFLLFGCAMLSFGLTGLLRGW